MQSWSEIRATKVPPDREAEAASSRAALRVALGLPPVGSAARRRFLTSLGEYVAHVRRAG